MDIRSLTVYSSGQPPVHRDELKLLHSDLLDLLQVCSAISCPSRAVFPGIDPALILVRCVASIFWSWKLNWQKCFTFHKFNLKPFHMGEFTVIILWCVCIYNRLQTLLTFPQLSNRAAGVTTISVHLRSSKTMPTFPLLHHQTCELGLQRSLNDSLTTQSSLCVPLRKPLRPSSIPVGARSSSIFIIPYRITAHRNAAGSSCRPIFNAVTDAHQSTLYCHLLHTYCSPISRSCASIAFIFLYVI